MQLLVCDAARRSCSGMEAVLAEGGAAAVALQMAEDGGLRHVVRRLRSSNPSVRTCFCACPLSACGSGRSRAWQYVVKSPDPHGGHDHGSGCGH